MLFVVAAALMDVNGRIFMQQRPEGKPMAGLWEFPGGKVQTGETPEQALQRELQEELGIHVQLEEMIPLSFVTHARNPVTHQPDDASLPLAHSADDMLLLLLYQCSTWQGTLMPQEGQSIIWANKKMLSTLPMPPADKPLLAFL